MPRVSDIRGKPGDIVMVRGGKSINVYRDPPVINDSLTMSAKILGVRSGIIAPKSIGIIVSVGQQAWTYVLWSAPCVLGWTADGELRKL